MVTIRAYKSEDFEEVVDMYYKMIHEVYPMKDFKEKQYFYKNIMNWIEWNYDIMVTEDEGVVTGFAMCYVDSMGGICEDYYQAECVYIKPEFRKGRSAYLIYHSCVIYAEKMGYDIHTNASSLSESHRIASKFGQELFKTYIRRER